jgi:metal-responsive CopG/Arc/MetJ family transcriptional regulator
MASGKRERTERVEIILQVDEVAVIDEFRFKARMPSRSAAVRELLRRGLASAAWHEHASDAPS